jgi:tRNA A37 N6-isopentenylltransferase MiaA
MLTESEIEERVSILKKLREYLTKKRDRLYSYLEVLDHEEEDILKEDAEKLKMHTEVEENIVKEIYAFQKVIDPLEEMYRTAYPAKDQEMSRLKESLKHIQDEALKRSKRNQKLLAESMEEVRNEIRSLRKINKNRPLYDADTQLPSMIDITT